MANERLVLCGDARPTSREAAWRRAPRVALRIGDGPGQIHLRIEQLARDVMVPLTDLEADLLELAAYVYAADQAISRGGLVRIDYGDAWRRRFRFEVPVRQPDNWRREEVVDRLSRTLEFLTGDEFEFAFRRHPNPPPLEAYLFDRADLVGQSGYEEVALFSGGLDSFGGAVQEVFGGCRRVALVSHRPENRVFARQQALVGEIRRRVPVGKPRPDHIPVLVNLGDGLVRDYHQRSRSFLYAAVAAVTARLAGLRRIRFYENGVTSLNLPASQQLVGTQASRTTHPRVLLGYERLFTLLFDGPFAVENPFQWKTKAHVLREICAAGFGDLCRMTCSCAHNRNRERAHPHCGNCSQCLDRRVAALAAGLTPEQDDPAGYETDVLAAPREGEDRVLFERYVGFARTVRAMNSDRDLLADYPEVQTELSQFGLAPAEAATEVFRLHQRHANDVVAGLMTAAGGRLEDVIDGQFPPTSLMGMCCVQSAGGRENPAGLAVGTNGQQRPSNRPYLDGDSLTLVCGRHTCLLGPTLEYRVAQYLADRFNRWVGVDELKLRVWNDAHTSSNAVYRVVATLRRRLRESGMAGASIESIRGRYRMTRSE
jgi:hypothetical protein